MTVGDRMEGLDRRWIFLVVALLVLLPLLFPLKLPLSQGRNRLLQWRTRLVIKLTEHREQV